jgi:hypothetical protein
MTPDGLTGGIVAALLDHRLHAAMPLASRKANCGFFFLFLFLTTNRRPPATHVLTGHSSQRILAILIHPVPAKLAERF